MKISALDRSAICAFLLCAWSGSTFALPHPSYTWKLNPGSGVWDTAINWMPEGIPDTTPERAVFGSSTVTNVTTSFETITSIEFLAGANQYSFDGGMNFHRGGVINNSGVVQTFNGSFVFSYGADAGSSVIYNTTFVWFQSGGNAGSGTFNLGVSGAAFTAAVKSTGPTSAGTATFNNSAKITFNKATAGAATFNNSGGESFGADGASIAFTQADAGSSTIVLEGGKVFGAHGARLSFNKSSANSATLIAKGGVGPGSGATILFTKSSGNTARVEVFGNGNIDFSRLFVATNTVGSIAGNGLVYLGRGNLAIGGNNLNTTFAGTITEHGGVQDGEPGSISKTGTGTLTLTTDNDYSAGTTILSGTIFVNNLTGSATGTGPVNVLGGTLAGAGSITGPVTLGGGSVGAILAPGANISTIGLLTVQDALKFEGNSSYEAELNSTSLEADEVVADGVTISSSAQILLHDFGAITRPTGTSSTLLNNTSNAAISGVFGDLPDGAAITVGSNTYVANYAGGDGNDLTLTVVP